MLGMRSPAEYELLYAAQTEGPRGGRRSVDKRRLEGGSPDRLSGHFRDRYVFGHEAGMERGKALGIFLLRRSGHPPRRCPHVLRADVTLSDIASGGVAVGPAG